MTGEAPVRRRWRWSLPSWPLQGWRRTAAFAAFGVACFLLFLTLTFPADAARARLQAEAERFGLVLRLDRLSAGPFGVTTTRLRLSRASDPSAVPVVLDEVTLRPTFFPPGLAVRAALSGGSASGSVSRSGQSMRARLSGIDLARGNLIALTGIDAEGKLDAELALDLPAARGEPDLAQGTGSVRLSGAGLLVKGGTVTLPMFGSPTPLDLPRTALGTLEVEVTFDRGAGTVKRFSLKGDDLEALGTGTMKLARRVEYVELALALRLRPEAEFLKRLGVFGAGFSVLPADPEQPGFRDVKVAGSLGRPLFNPGR